nr:MAG TPA: hypothetical protein [Caudoviricetes sp.]
MYSYFVFMIYPPCIAIISYLILCFHRKIQLTFFGISIDFNMIS